MKLCDCFIGQIVKCTSTLDNGDIGVIDGFTTNDHREVVPIVRWVTQSIVRVYPIHPANITNKGF